MFARVSTRMGTSDKVEETVQVGKERALPAARQIPGFAGLHLLVDRVTGKTVTITLWETEDALRESEQQTQRIRAAGTAVTGAETVSIEAFEVAIQELVGSSR